MLREGSRCDSSTWEKLLALLQMRGPLRGLALIMTCAPADRARSAYARVVVRPTGKPVHVLLTKADKLARSSAENSAPVEEKSRHLPPIPPCSFSRV